MGDTILSALDTFGTPELAPQLLAFLEGHRVELAAIIDARILTAVRVKALLACDGQAARAREELDANRTAFGVDQAAQLEAQIAQVEGEDIRPRLERIYDEAPTIINLTMLVHHLVQVQDWVALEPRVRELYRLERSLPNARMVAACLSNRPDRSPVAIVQFLQGENDVVARDRELMSELAWCSLECGDWKTARELNDVLLSDEPDSERHIGLDINIAVKSGDWEHFASIFDREWARRSNHSPRTLLLLAQLAHDGHVSTDKAFELVRLAAEKGFADVQVLVAAYNAAMHMGREDELSASWLLYAAQTDTSGIVKRVSTRELVEQVLPSLQRKNETLLDSFRNQFGAYTARYFLSQYAYGAALLRHSRGEREAARRAEAPSPAFLWRESWTASVVDYGQNRLRHHEHPVAHNLGPARQGAGCLQGCLRCS